MNSPRSKPDPDSTKEKIEVPRDPDVDTVQSSRRDVMPWPDTINMPDEDYPAANKPLPEKSPIARKHPLQGDNQLEVGPPAMRHARRKQES
ncbi:MAG: hypothetical protein ABIZ04_24030 [Opitutus sp.]